MRRLSAILMIAALLAALVPSVVLAGKPPAPNITSVNVVSGGPSTAVPGQCYVYVNVGFEGRVSEVYIKQHADGDLVDSEKWLTPAKKTFSVASTPFTSQLALKDYTWTVDLLDRKRNSLLAAPVDLGPEQLDSCPAVGVPILQYTAP